MEMPLVGDSKARMSYVPDLNNFKQNLHAEEEDEDDKESEEEVLPWDVFKHYPPKLKTGSKADTGFFETVLKITKLLTYGLLFLLVLGGGVFSKTTILFAVSQLDDHGPIDYCEYNEIEGRPTGRKLSVTIPKKSRSTWYWCIFLSFLVPEVIGLLNGAYHLLFKKRIVPKPLDMVFVLVVEGIHAIGLAILFLQVLPELNSVQAVVAASCTCFVPGFLGVLSRNGPKATRGRSFFSLVVDTVAFVCQIFGVLAWLLPDGDVNTTLTSKWLLPIALIMSSCRWWGNYVSPHSIFGFIRSASRIKERLRADRGITTTCTAVWRIFVFLASFVTIAYCKGIEPSWLFDSETFTGEHNVTLVDLSRAFSFSSEISDAANATLQDSRIGYLTVQSYYLPLLFLVVHAAAAFITYSSSKFACRTLMQGIGFALPASLVVPGSFVTIVVFCIVRSRDPCGFNGFLPDFLFFNAPGDVGSLPDFLGHWYPWIWLVTLMSQAWITRHIWSPHSEILASTERIFVVPTYDSLIVDQAIVLNRQIEQDLMEDNPMAESEEPVANESTNFGESSDARYFGVGKSDRVTRIIVCATMWHEIAEEMVEFVGSILRLDTDQGAKRFTQGYYKVELEDYYELETHIFFDDAFCCMHGCERRCKHNEDETRLNDYVICLINTMKETIERRGMRATPPIKYPTNYGGRLKWTLPGKTSLIVHLKDKNKIRHRKRWSQVMYMYYLLGHRLMDQPISRERKATIAENTYLLALDGDIDFRPSAVKVLVDLMKRDKDLGAVCGRIHPIGSGPMVWFQKFEYAIGHWLQKSTEHTVGSVLCSPGCFSLFRARALMEHNVMRKYAIQATEPRHYVQYDQGEDRWLCTLILQVGYRVEYSAASDSYTHAPESFNEFYNQRRRWIPSTIANIFDLLGTADETRKVNNDISWLYVAYQWVLMGSTVLGPGTIFLMLVGAFVAAFHIDNWSSFAYNLIPIAIFVIVCLACNANIQLMVAGIISAFYGLVMIVVLVGIMLQITEDGWSAPSTILFFVVAGQIVIAGLLHPQEWACLLCGLIYYVTVPSMYMLLIIFSVFNLNNVTWGTRDSKATSEETEDTEEGDQPKDAKSPPKEKPPAKPKQQGSIEFSLAGLFKCMLCTQDVKTDEDQKLKVLNESLDRIASRLDAMERNSDGKETPQLQRGEKLADKPKDFVSVNLTGAPTTHGQSGDYLDDSDDSDDDDNDDDSNSESDTAANEPSPDRDDFLVSPCWVQDERLQKGIVAFLSQEEEKFWKSLIGKYLYPLDEDKKKLKEIAEGLMQLRNEYLFKFFMVNALFVLIVFLMQLNKEVLHFEWPLGATYNITFVKTNIMEVHLEKDYLKLEPIGCLFIGGFVVILGIQFIAMLFHRWNTFAHLLANTNINWCSCNKTVDQTMESGMGRHAEDLADGLQRVVEDNAVPLLIRKSAVISPGKRKTVHELADSGEKRPKLPASIDALFRRNLNDPGSEITRVMSTLMPPKVFEAFEHRRSTIVADRRQSQHPQNGTDNFYHSAESVPGSSQQRLSVPRENGHTYDNRAYLSDDAIEEFPKNNVTIPHRPSQVKFGNPNA